MLLLDACVCSLTANDIRGITAAAKAKAEPVLMTRALREKAEKVIPKDARFGLL